MATVAEPLEAESIEEFGAALDVSRKASDEAQRLSQLAYQINQARAAERERPKATAAKRDPQKVRARRKAAAKSRAAQRRHR